MLQKGAVVARHPLSTLQAKATTTHPHCICQCQLNNLAPTVNINHEQGKYYTESVVTVVILNTINC